MASGMGAGVESPAALPWRSAPEDHAVFRCGHLSAPFLADPFPCYPAGGAKPRLAQPLRVLGIASRLGLTNGARFAPVDPGNPYGFPSPFCARLPVPGRGYMRSRGRTLMPAVAEMLCQRCGTQTEAVIADGRPPMDPCRCGG